ncbi:hypothetical protein DFH11DRAFT_1557904 [Phellopilus nigrolimitatus]|nr:hypothetical protein DFH11DRAFT_1557904 [Phellopilus nigrolimitatus]
MLRLSRVRISSSIRATKNTRPYIAVTEDTHSIDRSIFRKSVPVLAAHVPAAKAGLLLKAPALKRCVHPCALPLCGWIVIIVRSILKLSKTRSVVPDSKDGSGRLVLLKVQSKGMNPVLYDLL